MADVDRLQCFDCRIAPGSCANRNLASLVVQPIIAGTKYCGEPEGAPAVRGGDRVPAPPWFSVPVMGLGSKSDRERRKSWLVARYTICVPSGEMAITERSVLHVPSGPVGNPDLNSTVGDTRFHPA